MSIRGSRHEGRWRRSRGMRLSAGLLVFALVFATVAPSLARAEVESEGEGAAPPGSTLPGLEEGPGFEPVGEETGLAEVAAGTGEEEAEEPAPEEVEVAPPPEEPPAPAATGTEPAPEAPPPAEEAVPQSPSEPSDAPEEATPPSYEPSTPAPPVEAVRNEAIVAPRTSTPDRGRSGHRASEAPGPTGEPAPTEPELPIPAPEPAAEPAAVPVAGDGAGRLRGKGLHTVAPGECLWSVAEAMLPPGASDGEIASEVALLWRLNAARIGTGDPDLILVGTVLRLHR